MSGLGALRYVLKGACVIEACAVHALARSTSCRRLHCLLRQALHVVLLESVAPPVALVQRL